MQNLPQFILAENLVYQVKHAVCLIILFQKNYISTFKSLHPLGPHDPNWVCPLMQDAHALWLQHIQSAHQRVCV